jgi:hypothetical protein
MHVEQAAPQPIDRPLSALECYESRGWPNMLKANIGASEFPLSAPRARLRRGLGHHRSKSTLR